MTDRRSAVDGAEGGRDADPLTSLRTLVNEAENASRSNWRQRLATIAAGGAILGAGAALVYERQLWQDRTFMQGVGLAGLALLIATLWPRGDGDRRNPEPDPAPIPTAPSGEPQPGAPPAPVKA